jgi:hypothetical protein
MLVRDRIVIRCIFLAIYQFFSDITLGFKHIDALKYRINVKVK